MWAEENGIAGSKIRLCLCGQRNSSEHAEYLRLGGQGSLPGDSNLRYGREDIWETYYRAHLLRGVFASGRLQFIANLGQSGPGTGLGAWHSTSFGFLGGEKSLLPFFRSPSGIGGLTTLGFLVGSAPQVRIAQPKHAVLGFTESLRTELLHDKSKVHLGNKLGNEKQKSRRN